MVNNILVTGADGFIGSHLVELLVAEGLDVSVVDDLSRGQREWVPDGCKLYEFDVRDADAVLAVVREAGADSVVHLAALHFIPAVDDAPELAWSINVDGTKNLLEALRDAPPKRLLFASTAAVYPDLVRSLEYSFDRKQTRRSTGEAIENGVLLLSDKPGWGVEPPA